MHITQYLSPLCTQVFLHNFHAASPWLHIGYRFLAFARRLHRGDDSCLVSNWPCSKWTSSRGSYLCQRCYIGVWMAPPIILSHSSQICTSSTFVVDIIFDLLTPTHTPVPTPCNGPKKAGIQTQHGRSSTSVTEAEFRISISLQPYTKKRLPLW